MTARSGHAARLSDRRRNGIMSRHTTVTPRSSGPSSTVAGSVLKRVPLATAPAAPAASPGHLLAVVRGPHTHPCPLLGLAPPCEAIYMRQSATMHRQEHTHFRHTGHENQASLNLASLLQSIRPTG